MNIWVAICDDMEYYVGEVKGFCKQYRKAGRKDIDCTGFSNPLEMLANSKHTRYDIALLDVEMPEMNGIELGRQMKEYNPDLLIIYITSYPQFAYEASQVEAFGYISKPLDINHFFRLMDRAAMMIKVLQEQMFLNCRFLSITSEYEKKQLPVKDIVVVQKYSNSVLLITKTGKEYRCYMTLRKMEEQLNRRKFIKISSNCFLHIIYVKGMDDNCVITQVADEDKYYSVSRKCMDSVRLEVQRHVAKKSV